MPARLLHVCGGSARLPVLPRAHHKLFQRKHREDLLEQLTATDIYPEIHRSRVFSFRASGSHADLHSLRLFRTCWMRVKLVKIHGLGIVFKA